VSAPAVPERCPKCGRLVLRGHSGMAVCSDDECDYFVIRAGAVRSVVAAEQEHPAVCAVRDYFAALLEVARADTDVANLGAGFVVVLDDGHVLACRREDAAGFLRELASEIEGRHG
jgi:hypothetical protein